MTGELMKAMARRLADRAYEPIRQNDDPATQTQRVLGVFKAAVRKDQKDSGRRPQSAGQSGGGT